MFSASATPFRGRSLSEAACAAPIHKQINYHIGKVKGSISEIYACRGLLSALKGRYNLPVDSCKTCFDYSYITFGYSFQLEKAFLTRARPRPALHKGGGVAEGDGHARLSVDHGRRVERECQPLRVLCAQVAHVHHLLGKADVRSTEVDDVRSTEVDD
eukprot:1185553-Prorocentrum_minimum.AAC.1